jgi:two-component system, LuxR family, response regulator FixJ
MSSEPTVFIVDDDEAFRESLAVLILSMGYKSQTYASGEAFLSVFDENRSGCIILDVRMPNESGLAVQEKLAKFPLCPPVIILTGHAEVPLALRAMRQGAIEFLQKTFTESELRETIERAMTLDAENRKAQLRKREVAEKLALLARPELDVLELVLAGHPNKKIASVLNISQRAVEDRRSRVMKKVEVDSLPELVRFAIEAGLKVQET